MESGGIHIHERFFRHIWCNQYLRTAELSTTDGRAVHVVDPGRLNPYGGPDIHGAVIVVGDVTFAGDVEIHRSANDWPLHGHNTDAAYNMVILHVVLRTPSNPPPTLTASGRRVPVLVLESFLHEPLHSLLRQMIHDEDRTGEIPCRSRNASIAANLLDRWIGTLARQRMEMKMQRFHNRLRELAAASPGVLHEPWRHYRRPRIEGSPDEIPLPAPELRRETVSSRTLWDQVLFEGLMDGLGYSRNRRAFLRLADIARLDRIRSLGIVDDLTAISSFLFGISGLLPKRRDLHSHDSKEYVRVLLKNWRRMRASVPGERVYPSEWNFFPTRPGNFPALRIAAGAAFARMILANDLFRRMIQAFISTDDPRTILLSIRTLLQPSPDPFWTNHYHFDLERPRGKAVGMARLNDIIANTVLPLSLLYARIFHDGRVRKSSLALYEHFPPLVSNAITRMMEVQLLRGKVQLASMKMQQGVIQLHNSYCSEGRCSRCEIGKVVF